MRTFSLALVIAIVVPNYAHAETKWRLELAGNLVGDNPNPQANVLLGHTFTEYVGAWGFVLLAPNYAEFYAGVSVTPAPWLEFGIGVGAEQGSPSYVRFGGFLWAGHDRYSALVLVEHGGTGPWWRVEANVDLWRGIGIGAIAQSDGGIGPLVEAKIPKVPIVAWGGPTFHWWDGSWGALFGIRALFKS